MFADSLLDVTWAQRSRRSLTTLTSFGMQAIVMGLLLLLPLWKTVMVPAPRTVSTPISLGRAEPESARIPRTGGGPVTPSNSLSPRFVAPGRIPTTIPRAGNDAVPQLPGGGGGDGVPGVGLPGSPDGLPFSVFSGTRPVPLPAPAPASVRPLFISNILEGSLIRRVTPAYPYAAKIAHVQGRVVLSAVISKAGAIEDLRVLSGHPLLVGAATQAVRQWRYRPYILNREPIEVETQITVNFTLSGN